MARIRTVKPDFFTSDDICDLSMAARLLYIGTWCEADREGRMEWSPRSLKRRYLPDDSVNIDEVCAELTKAGLVVLYGDGLAYIPTFAKHQHVNPREAESKIDAPEFCASTTRAPRVPHASLTVDAPGSDTQGGRKGTEGKEYIGQHAARFGEFWELYPNRKGKADALKAWQRKKLDAIADKIIADVKARIADDRDWKRGYVPHGSTYVNSEGWQDDVGGDAASLSEHDTLMAGVV